EHSMPFWSSPAFFEFDHSPSGRVCELVRIVREAARTAPERTLGRIRTAVRGQGPHHRL
ncbi:MAG: hypothetical protein AVDCRST_MAG91-3528, partial [uncultured Sphingomonadaceae bacterium]